MRRSFGYLTKEGFRNIRVNRLMSVASIAVLLSCLIMIGSASMILLNIQRVIDNIDDKNVIMVYVKDTADEQMTRKLGDEIKALPNVSHCTFIDKETAFKQQLEQLESSANYFEGVENPLPDVYEVSVDDMGQFESTAQKIKKLDSVGSVRDNKDLALTLIRLRSGVTYFSLGVIALLLLVSLFIISNTVRITMFSRRLEISIMKSVGATNGFIRWPFLIEGMILGVISACLALAGVWGLYEFGKKSLVSVIGNMLSLQDSLLDFKPYAPYMFIAFLIVGIISGVFGSAVSIRRYLREPGGVTYDNED